MFRTVGMVVLLALATKGVVTIVAEQRELHHLAAQARKNNA